MARTGPVVSCMGIVSMGLTHWYCNTVIKVCRVLLIKSMGLEATPPPPLPPSFHYVEREEPQSLRLSNKKEIVVCLFTEFCAKILKYW